MPGWGDEAPGRFARMRLGAVVYSLPLPRGRRVARGFTGRRGSTRGAWSDAGGRDRS